MTAPAPAPEPPPDQEVARFMATFSHPGMSTGDLLTLRQEAERVVALRRTTEAQLEAEHAASRAAIAERERRQAAAQKAEAVFPHLTHCARCGEFLRGRIWRSLYTLPGVCAAFVFCDACNGTPIDSPADAGLRAWIEWIETQALTHAPVRGRE